MDDLTPDQVAPPRIAAHLALEGREATAHHRNTKAHLHDSLDVSDWVTRCLRNCIDEFTARIQSGLAILASVGSTAPFIGLFGMSAGNLYQKARCAEMPLFAGSAAQCASCALACGLGAAAFESGDIAWTGEFVMAVGWMALVVSVGAVSILYVLIRRGEVSRVAGLFYLIPVVAALAAWGLFGQGVTMIQWLGMAVAGSGMLLVTRRPG